MLASTSRLLLRPTLPLPSTFTSLPCICRSLQTTQRHSSAAAALKPLPDLAPSPPSPSKPTPPTKQFKPLKAAITLTPAAASKLRCLYSSPKPQLIRIGVRNKGCAGMSYHLEYVDKPSRFDEVVTQDGVTVLVDSKALFSIIGSTMDWREDVLMSKFVFNNPNIKEACGCGESFLT